MEQNVRQKAEELCKMKTPCTFYAKMRFWNEKDEHEYKCCFCTDEQFDELYVNVEFDDQIFYYFTKPEHLIDAIEGREDFIIVDIDMGSAVISESFEKKTMAKGVNRFLFYCWNYEGERNAVDGYWYPSVILHANWTCDRQHICAKYMHSLDKVGSNFALADLYGDLDNNNRIVMLEWIMNNENHAPKLYKN